MIKKFYSLLCFPLVMVLFSCSGGLKKEYSLLKKSGLSQEELVTAISDFDKAHYRFFDSKLDLGVYSLVQLDYEKAFSYFNRALALLDSGENCSKAQRALLYSSLSTVYISRKDIYKAQDFAKKAWKCGREGKVYGFLYGRILYSTGDNETALQVFDKTYKKYPQNLDKDSRRTYMYLLGDMGLYERCIELIQLNAGQGDYFENFGTFASEIFERTGDIEQAVYYSYLEYLFRKSKENLSDDEFLKNLDLLESALQKEGVAKGGPAIRQIRALLSKKDELVPCGDNFISKYIWYQQKIQLNELTLDDYKEFARLEPYFCKLVEFYQTLLVQSEKFLTTNNPAVKKMLKDKIRQLGGKYE